MRRIDAPSFYIWRRNLTNLRHPRYRPTIGLGGKRTSGFGGQRNLIVQIANPTPEGRSNRFGGCPIVLDLKFGALLLQLLLLNRQVPMPLAVRTSSSGPCISPAPG